MKNLETINQFRIKLVHRKKKLGKGNWA